MTRQDELRFLIETIKNTLGVSGYIDGHVADISKGVHQDFSEDNVYTGQFCKLYEGRSIYGECHYLTHARFSITRGIDVMHHVTRFDGKDIMEPVMSRMQHINLGPSELEALFIGYLEWSMLDQGIDLEQGETIA